MPVVYNCLNIIQNWLYPPICVLCGMASGRDLGLCHDCEADLPLISTACRQCARPLPGASARGPHTCGRCQQRPPPVTHTLSPLAYRYPVAGLIHRYKYGRQLALAAPLGYLLGEHIVQQADTLPGLIIPVPLHASRLRTRGFNPSLELARQVGRRLAIPVDLRSTRRVINTASQAGLSARARQHNVRGAFRITAPIPASHVALLDDVMTTGHTVMELARVLRGAGVARVDAWVLARAAPEE
jgi:ComF family protein